MLAARVRGALAGQGQVVLLAGEPGIGKTRLAEETAGMAAMLAMPCRWGRATDEEGSPPYWPFRQVLRALGEAVLGSAAAEVALVAPEVAGRAPSGGPVGAQERFRLFEAVTAVLVAAAEPDGLLVVLDRGDEALGDRPATLSELSTEDLHLVTSFVDALVTKTRLKALAGGVS